ncbi:Hypothetical protein R9X50_00060000 [Acrodontium crateriforme]|uniref:Uncharacterized protein n=1 Tax=Acrodontium crateriforme TaxID=150365 RepID=A0AAQ3LXS5_9PEZI|nr:Hypothetical protein R9X50_00060000 [Acrodontium crateriforme]
MSQPKHTAGRQSNLSSASRTPQNRSNTSSPSAQNPSQPPKQQPAPVPNVWAQRSSNAAASSNGQPRVDSARQEPSTAFNAAEVKAFLGREVPQTSYKPTEAPGATRNSGAWGAKVNTMANGQPFFVQLAKQIATMEGGG